MRCGKCGQAMVVNVFHGWVVDDNFGSGGAFQGHINDRHSDPRTTTPDAK
jgi:hypothetical protein